MATDLLPTSRAIRVLLVDDDEDDYVLTREMFAGVAGKRFHLNAQLGFARSQADGGLTGGNEGVRTLRRAHHHAGRVHRIDEARIVDRQ